MSKMLSPFEEASRLLHDRVNLEQWKSFTSQDLEGRLERLQNILDSLGNPETGYHTIHVAGTKGKGSTCVMLESLLCVSGCRVGRFTSPHIHCFTERLMVNGLPCPHHEFAELFFDVYNKVESALFQSLTYFELLTLLAFLYFAKMNVDIAIFEVGLGGRLDATNLCRPNVSVITSISFDHMAQLGTTLAEIAAEKSGIIKPGVPVVTAVLHSEPLKVIRVKSQSVSAPLYVLDEHFFIQQTTPQYTFRYEAKPPQFPVELTLEHLALTMPGVHQIQNASTAISAFLLIQRHKEQKETKSRIRTAIQNAALPLRVEIVQHNEEYPTLIFDGAHNKASIQALMQTVTDLFPNRRLFLMFGSSLDKDVSGMFAEIKGCFHHVFLTQSSHTGRCFPPQELRVLLALPESEVSIIEDYKDAWERCRRMTSKEDVICIAGSLYLAAELRTHILL